MLVNILHLTDIHFTQRSRHNQDVVFKALFESLRREADSALKPDLLVLSGDLVDRPDEEDVYGYFLDEFLEPVLRASNLGETRVVLTPGNHDLPRSFVEQNRKEQQSWVETLTSRDALNRAFFGDNLTSFAIRKLSAFDELRSLIGGQYSYLSPFSTVRDFADLGISVVELNSSWMGWSGLDKISDAHQLLIPEAAVSEALASVPPDRQIVLVTHHPNDWLADFSGIDVSATLGGKPAVHLFGHMHLPNPKLVTGVHGSTYEHQGGAVFTDRRYYQGYSILRLETDGPFVAAHLRSYYENRRAFDTATDICPKGVFFPNEKSQAHFQAVVRTVDRAALASWRQQELLPYTLKRFAEGVVDRNVNEIFVAPPMQSEVEYRNKDNEQPQVVEHDLSFEELISSKENYLISGRQEYGKTTLLRQIATNLLSREGNAPTVPVVLSFADIRDGTERVEALIRGELPELPDGCAVKVVLQEGLGVVLVDDVIFTDRKRYNVLLDFVRTYPRSRFIFSTPRSGNAFQAAVDLEAVVHFEQAVIKPMRRRDVRHLVNKWDRDNAIDRDAILDRLIADIGTMSLPLTALNTTILLSIFEGNQNFAPINKTALIERFAEMLLDKASANEVARKSFDFKNKTHFLSKLAAFMANSDKYVLSEIEILNFTNEYLEDMGLDQDVSKLVQSMLDARVIAKRSDGSISFRYRAFLEYYVAQAMAIDREFRQWVVAEERYLSFINEIQYYSGVNRDDAELLKVVGERFAQFNAKLFGKLEQKVDLSQLDNLSLPQKEDDTETILRHVEQEISAPPLSEEERDEILDAELPQDVEGRQEVFRPRPTDLGQEWLTALIIYSNVLRGTELVKDQLKRDHLAKVLEGWATAMHLTLWQIPKVAKDRQFVVNGVKFDVRLPPGFTEGEAARLLFMHVPNSMAELAYNSVGTEKLDRQLAVVDSEPGALHFLRTSLRVRLNLATWVEDAKAFLAKARDRTFFSNAMVWKLTEHHVLRPMTDSTRGKLQAVMASAIADLRGGTKSQRDEMKEKRLRDLRRAYLLSKVTAKRDS